MKKFIIKHAEMILNCILTGSLLVHFYTEHGYRKPIFILTALFIMAIALYVWGEIREIKQGIK